MAQFVSRIGSSARRRHPRMPVAATTLVAIVLSIAATPASADETGANSRFEEHQVEFHNQDVKFAGSLLLPVSETPVPAVVFVHGAGRQTRESYRELGEHFASRGIAALIYDKRGTGQSGGVYESHAPYENLVNDALAAVAFLKERREIESTQIGIWGLSQGARISAAAASRSDDIQFVIVVGASVADGQMFYYRDNLFRRYGLSGTLRDVAEKAHLAQCSLPHNLPDGFGLATFTPRSYPPPDQFVHPAWSRVHQPVLAMWGQLDQNVPVGESVAGLKNSLAQSNNESWTILIVPGTNHDLQLSETGEIQSEAQGYPPEALNAMTDWAWAAILHPSSIGNQKMEGIAPDAGILPRLARYERLRWFGNGTVQAALWMLFLISFGANAVESAWCCWRRLCRREQPAASPWNRTVNLKRAIGALNLLILIALSITVLLVLDQLHPSCPSFLTFSPLLGSVSTLATALLLVRLVRTPSDPGWRAGRRIRFSLDVLCLILFVPFLFYWNLIGYRF